MSTKKKVGLTIFWLSAAYMVGVGWFGGWSFGSTYRNHSLAEINATAWALSSPLFWIWAFSVPVGSVLAGLALLLYCESRPSHIWIFVVGMFSVMALIEFLRGSTHHPPIYGVVGGLVLACFLLILWFWAKKQSVLSGRARIAANLQLVGYVFMLLAMWNICGTLGSLFYEALSSDVTQTPISIILYLGSGWIFLLLSHYVESTIQSSPQ
jgi:hypothetical protein